MAPRDLLLGSFHAALAAADPLKIVPQHLPKPPKGRTLVVGAGKAAASMALAVEQNWPASAPLEGLVITRYQHGQLTNRVTVIEAGHPVPDQSGATRALGSEGSRSHDGVRRAPGACAHPASWVTRSHPLGRADAEQPERVISRRELMQHLWASEHVGDEHACEVHISNLRRKIEKDPTQPERLVTVRGMGYKLVAA